MGGIMSSAEGGCENRDKQVIRELKNSTLELIQVSKIDQTLDKSLVFTLSENPNPMILEQLKHRGWVVEMKEEDIEFRLRVPFQKYHMYPYLISSVTVLGISGIFFTTVSLIYQLKK
jgi:hypothetical protein